MIPDYQTLMLPLLRLVADGQEHAARSLVEKLADEFHVTDDERRELLTSGVQPVFDNRVGWARTYLKKAGLLESPRRATVVISELGRQTLAKNPDRIDTKFLRQFPSFLEFQSPSRNVTELEEELTERNSNQTPTSVDPIFKSSSAHLPDRELKRVFLLLHQTLPKMQLSTSLKMKPK